MAAAQTRAGFGLGAIEAAGRAHVDNLFTATVDIGQELLYIAQQKGVLARREMTVPGHYGRIADRPPFSPPFRKAAIEHRNRAGAPRAA